MIKFILKNGTSRNQAGESQSQHGKEKESNDISSSQNNGCNGKMSKHTALHVGNNSRVYTFTIEKLAFV